MASVIIGNPLLSGSQIIISGNPWSGTIPVVGGIQFRLDRTASGNVYLGFSGNMTFTSGGMFLSGGGLSDGFPLAPGDGFFVPKLSFASSGSYNVYAWADSSCSGQARLWYQPF